MRPAGVRVQLAGESNKRHSQDEPKPAAFGSNTDVLRFHRRVLPEVTAPVDERGRDEHERKREKRRQAEVELQIVPHVM